MTIGIGAYGPNAGLAVFRALRAAERVATGAIGGFATFAAITAEGRALHAVTQRGGAATAFVDGETTGVEPPSEFASARVAAVISSGPDRPGDLTKLVPVDPAVGLVSGHRIVSTCGANGKPMNGDALARMRGGASAFAAAGDVAAENPEADCGLICVDVSGSIGIGNTARVARRPDVACALREGRAIGAAVAVLHNSIRPLGAVAELAAAIALQTMQEDTAEIGFVSIVAGTPILVSEEDAVFCEPDGRVLRVTMRDPACLRQTRLAAPYLGSSVWIEGQRVGETTVEPVTTAENGRLIAFGGRSDFRLAYRRTLHAEPAQAATREPDMKGRSPCPS